MQNTPSNCSVCHCPTDYDEIHFARLRDQDGFFCANDACEQYIYFDTTRSKPVYKLFLEDATNHNVALSPTKTPIKFDKRLSPLRYPGGKSLLIDFTYQHLNQNQCQTLFSPFAGGASMELAFLQAGVVNHLVLNDLDPYLYQFYEQAIYHTDDLIECIRTEDLSVNLYEQAHAYVNEKATPDITESEAAFYYLINNRCSFSGIYKAGRLGGKNGNLKTLSARWNPKNLILRLEKLKALRDHITLTRLDFTEFIETYAWQNGTFLIDPPYVTDQAQAIYRHAFDSNQHKQLFDTLNQFHHSFPTADFFVYYDNHPKIQEFEIPEDCEIISRRYSIAN